MLLIINQYYFINKVFTKYSWNNYLSAPNPPSVTLNINAVDHRNPPVQLHGKFFKNFLRPKHNISCFTVQFVLKKYIVRVIYNTINFNLFLTFLIHMKNKKPVILLWRSDGITRVFLVAIMFPMICLITVLTDIFLFKRLITLKLNFNSIQNKTLN